MTRASLFAWLTGQARLLDTIASWLFGPLGFARGYVMALARFLTTVAGEDAILDVIVASLEAEGVALPTEQVPSEEEFALLAQARTTLPSRATPERPEEDPRGKGKGAKP